MTEQLSQADHAWHINRKKKKTLNGVTDFSSFKSCNKRSCKLLNSGIGTFVPPPGQDQGRMEGWGAASEAAAGLVGGIGG